MRRSILLFAIFVILLCIASWGENKDKTDVNINWVNNTNSLTVQEESQPLDSVAPKIVLQKQQSFK